MDLIFPSNNHGVVSAPLNRSGSDPGLRVVFAVLALEVAADYPYLSLCSDEGYKSSGGRHTRMLEGAILQDFVFGFRRVNQIYGLVNSEENLNRAR